MYTLLIIRQGKTLCKLIHSIHARCQVSGQGLMRIIMLPCTEWSIGHLSTKAFGSYKMFWSSFSCRLSLQTNFRFSQGHSLCITSPCLFPDMYLPRLITLVTYLVLSVSASPIAWPDEKLEEINALRAKGVSEVRNHSLFFPNASSPLPLQTIFLIPPNRTRYTPSIFCQKCQILIPPKS